MPCHSPKPYSAEMFRQAKLSKCRFQESGVRLVIGGGSARCYKLDNGFFRPQDKCVCPPSRGTGSHRCDGVIIGCVQNVCYVIFVDLKSGHGQKAAQKAAEQILDTICYFCLDTDGENSSGKEHHEKWPPHEKRLFQGHKVVALIMNNKQPRNVPGTWCGKKVLWRSIGEKRSWLSLEDLLADIGPL